MNTDDEDESQEQDEEEQSRMQDDGEQSQMSCLTAPCAISIALVVVIIVALIAYILRIREQSSCFGFWKCPQYPLPYSFGSWPTTYDYSGSFPPGFVWGVGTAAYQIEGAYREGGRGASIWDTFTGSNTVGMPGANCSYCCKEPPCPINEAMISKGATGNTACDHYHMFRSDVALMKSMGLKHYRFSIAWPRLVPTGRVSEGVSQDAVVFYNSLIDELIAAGITPYVTLYHWDLPQGLLDPPQIMGWWSTDAATGEPNGQIIPEWLDYADLCFRLFGDRVKTWFTFNEAWTFTFIGALGHAPHIPGTTDLARDPWIAGHNVLIAHAKAVQLYRQKYKEAQGGQIGITNCVDWREPKTESPADIAAAERQMEFKLGWFADPIFKGAGDYPPRMREFYGKRLPTFTEDQKRLLNGSADIFGLNTYGTAWAAHSDKPGNDLTYSSETFDGFPQGQSRWLHSCGWGFRKLLNWVDRRYHHVPIYVTENGWSMDAVNASQGAGDLARVEYYANYTAEMHKAIYEDGVDVRGYFAWSFMDNFEWSQGYTERFGVTYTNYAFGLDPNAPAEGDRQPTAGKQTRRRKDSSCWLEAVWRSNELTAPDGLVFESVFQGCMSSSVFNGSYADPRHPGCARHIILNDAGTAGEVHGANAGLTALCNNVTDKAWGPYPAVLSGGSIDVQFEAEGRPVQLLGYWNRADKAIEWGDGNTWTLLA